MSRLGIQANEIAEKVGVTPGAVSNWMSGVNEAKGKNLRKLAAVLSCDPHWLSSGVESSSLTLQESPHESDLEIWKRRAIAAEKKLTELRAGLKFLTDVSSNNFPISSITRAEAEAIVDQIEELADRDLQGSHPPSPSESEQLPPFSPGSKTPNVP